MDAELNSQLMAISEEYDAESESFLEKTLDIVIKFGGYVANKCLHYKASY